MKNKNTIAIVLVLIIAVTALAFGSLSSTSGLFNFAPKVQAQTAPQISSQVLYDRVFRLVISFKEQGELQEQSGEEPTAFLNYFKDKVQLTDQENEILSQIAIEFIFKVEPIDDQAETLIAEIRKDFPEGYLEPPKELIDLQEQRDNIALLHRDKLSGLLGSVKFSEFDNFVQGDFASGIQVLPLSSNPNNNNPGGRK